MLYATLLVRNNARSRPSFHANRMPILFERVGFGRTSDFPQSLPSHALSDLGQCDAFRIGQSQSGRKLRSEDPAFRRQILIL
jgi:hypothetical protein